MSDARTNRIIGLPTKRPFKVVVCFITLVAFVFNIVSYDFAWADRTPSELTSVGSDRAVGPGSFKELNPRTFSMPQSLGTIKDTWSPAFYISRRGQNYTSSKIEKDNFGLARDEYGSQPPVVIHIQDAHCNYYAQNKIAEICEYLNKEYGVNTINLEGGAEDYDLSIFTDIADKSVRKRVADSFVKDGVVNGAEYFALNNPGKVTLWGIEDPKLYIENLKVYRESLRYKDDRQRLLKNLSYILTNLRMKLYSKELLELDVKYSQYKSGGIDLKIYLNYLIANAKARLIDIKSFRNVFLLNQTLKAEGDIDFDKANNQRDALIDKLQKKMSRNMLKELVSKTVEFKAEKISQEEFYIYLIKTAKLMGISIEGYPELEKYIVYISSYAGIDKAKIIDEISALETKMRETLYRNDTERELDKLSKDLVLTKNIFNISISRDDYKYYKANEEAFDTRNYVKFIECEAPLCGITAKLDDGIARLDQYRNQISKFYEYSFKRDEVFIKNLVTTNPSSVIARAAKRGEAIPFLKSAILITGGFHTENLCEMFRKQGIAYISIMPNFTIRDGYECPYFKILSGEQNIWIRQALPGVLNSALAPLEQLSPKQAEELVEGGVMPRVAIDPAARLATSVPVALEPAAIIAGDVTHEMAKGVEGGAFSKEDRAASVDELEAKYDVEIRFVAKDELEAKARELGMAGDVGNGIGFVQHGRPYVFILQDYKSDRELIMHEVTEALARQIIGGIAIAGAQNGTVSALFNERIQKLNEMADRQDQPLSYAYHGTSLYALLGAKMAGNRLLCREEADKLGIYILSGEGGAYGGDVGKANISVTHLYRIARAYAEKYSGGYKEVADLGLEGLNVTRNQLINEITALEKQAKDIEKMKHSIMYKQKQRDLSDIERRINYLNNTSAEERASYQRLLRIPIVIGVTESAFDQTDKEEFPNEVERHIPGYIDFRNVSHIYTAENNVAAVKSMLQKMGFANIEVLPFETVDLLFFSNNEATKNLAKRFIGNVGYGNYSYLGRNVSNDADEWQPFSFQNVISAEMETIQEQVKKQMNSEQATILPVAERKPRGELSADNIAELLADKIEHVRQLHATDIIGTDTENLCRDIANLVFDFSILPIREQERLSDRIYYRLFDAISTIDYINPNNMAQSTIFYAALNLSQSSDGKSRINRLVMAAIRYMKSSGRPSSREHFMLNLINAISMLASNPDNVSFMDSRTIDFVMRVILNDKTLTNQQKLMIGTIVLCVADEKAYAKLFNHLQNEVILPIAIKIRQERGKPINVKDALGFNDLVRRLSLFMIFFRQSALVTSYSRKELINRIKTVTQASDNDAYKDAFNASFQYDAPSIMEGVKDYDTLLFILAHELSHHLFPTRGGETEEFIADIFGFAMLEQLGYSDLSGMDFSGYDSYFAQYYSKSLDMRNQHAVARSALALYILYMELGQAQDGLLQKHVKLPWTHLAILVHQLVSGRDNNNKIGFEELRKALEDAITKPTAKPAQKDLAKDESGTIKVAPFLGVAAVVVAGAMVSAGASPLLAAILAGVGLAVLVPTVAFRILTYSSAMPHRFVTEQNLISGLIITVIGWCRTYDLIETLRGAILPLASWYLTKYVEYRKGWNELKEHVKDYKKWAKTSRHDSSAPPPSGKILSTEVEELLRLLSDDRAKKALIRLSEDPSFANVYIAAVHLLKNRVLNVEKVLNRIFNSHGNPQEEYMGELVSACAMERAVKYSRITVMSEEHFGSEIDFVLDVDKTKYAEGAAAHYELEDGAYIVESKTENADTNIDVIMDQLLSHNMPVNVTLGRLAAKSRRTKLENYTLNTMRMRNAGGRYVTGIIFVIGGDAVRSDGIEKFTLSELEQGEALEKHGITLFEAYVPDVVIAKTDARGGLSAKESKFVDDVVNSLGDKIDTAKRGECHDILAGAVARNGVSRTQFEITRLLKEAGAKTFSRAGQTSAQWESVFRGLAAGNPIAVKSTGGSGVSLNAGKQLEGGTVGVENVLSGFTAESANDDIVVMLEQEINSDPRAEGDIGASLANAVNAGRLPADKCRNVALRLGGNVLADYEKALRETTVEIVSTRDSAKAVTMPADVVLTRSVSRERFKNTLTRILSSIRPEELSADNLDRVLNENSAELFSALKELQKSYYYPAGAPENSQTGMCAIVSKIFCEAFNGLFSKTSNARIVFGYYDTDTPENEYYWILTDNNIAIDITYGGFGNKYTGKVLVTTRGQLLSFDLHPTQTIEVELKDEILFAPVQSKPVAPNAEEGANIERAGITAGPQVFVSESPITVGSVTTTSVPSNSSTTEFAGRILNDQLHQDLADLQSYGINLSDVLNLAPERVDGFARSAADAQPAERKSNLGELVNKIKDVINRVLGSAHEFTTIVTVYDEGDGQPHSVYVITGDREDVLSVGDTGVFTSTISAQVATAPAVVEISRSAAAGVAQTSEIDERREAVVKASEKVTEPGSVVKVLIGVLPTEKMSAAKVQTAISGIDDALLKNGYGDRNDNQMIGRFVIALNEDGSVNREKTRDNMVKALDAEYRMRAKDGASRHFVVYVPQMAGVEDLINDTALTDICDPATTTLVPDAYSDCAISADGKGKNTFPDIIARVILARLIVQAEKAEKENNLQMRNAILGAAKTLLQNISLNRVDGVETVEQLMAVLRLTGLRVKPVNYSDIDNWKNSQILTASSA